MQACVTILGNHEMKKTDRLVIIGAGNIGTAIATGLVTAKSLGPKQITLCDVQPARREWLESQGFATSASNTAPLGTPCTVLVSVEPHHADDVLREIAPSLQPGRHVLISVMAGVTIGQLRKHIGTKLPIVRAMPNTAIAIRESMTCLATDKADTAPIERAKAIFDTVGKTLVINEEQMTSATALGACGIAFFLRAIRAASQGGIEIGFSSAAALTIAIQTAKGAACLLQMMGKHPESEIDRVTTPRGCTIAGLNQMEHEGFSSAIIKGIVTAAHKADDLYAHEK